MNFFIEPSKMGVQEQRWCLGEIRIAILKSTRSWRIFARFAETQPADLDESPLQGNATEGERIFGDICAACHGRTGAGYQETANGTGIGRSVFLDSVTNGYLRYIIRHGKSNTMMRGFGTDDPVAVANLSDEDIENVIAYLREHAW